MSALLVCLVIAVADGDTLTCLTEQHEQVRVRLVEIDAPENGQAFGNRSKQALAKMCHRTQASIRSAGKDRYGRTLGRVTCNGIDANAEQVRQGMAWVYDQYVTDRSLYSLQAEAKGAKRGLWSDPAPLPPWEWRRGQTAPQTSAATSYEVRGNRNSGIYHVPGCRNYHDISPRNRVIFRSESEAQDAGYRRARNCR